MASTDIPRSPFNLNEHYPVVPQRFIRVLYGNNQEIISNPYCLVRILLESIKRRCECGREEMIDLADDNGNLINLYMYDNHYANEYLKDSSAYVLIGINESGSNRQYTSLLNEPSSAIEAMLFDLNSAVNEKVSSENPQIIDLKSRQSRKLNPQPSHKKQLRTVIGTPDTNRTKKFNFKKTTRK
ncbi:Uncharacterized protein CXorf65 [Trichoplax sp. H2]|uniref:Uncharacterized protein n=1 Tax=Trichoplax adhaerens TaxID=10228 RepID=B3S4C2_TRIAD|nr:expressed hypothetical protein [Trichoplax adhaerens]EDV22435.1 expressed hypothetical protein [Trichoplax adhaerens]RDD41129.1 Uncharacterized protein CXorf65 [Trichoplax sp. H2]|eukprot:XP_002114979.1 expressed hypothetical protein [Trichoplax adhaerens]